MVDGPAPRDSLAIARTHPFRRGHRKVFLGSMASFTRNLQPDASMTFTTRQFLLFAVLAALLAAGILSLGLGGGFMLDDAPTILENAPVHMKSLGFGPLMEAATSFFAGDGLRPLAMASFALDYWREGGLDPMGFKATNLLIHALTVIALAAFTRRLLLLAQLPSRRASIAALALALLWAVHPLQVSSVLYVVQRMQTLATLFLLLALWSYLRLREAEMDCHPGRRFGLLTVVFWLLALASKEDAILLPAYTLVLEWTVLHFRTVQPATERSLKRLYLLMLIGGTALYLFWLLPHYGSSTAYDGREFNSTERLMSQARVLVMYLGQIVLPIPGHMPFNYDTFEASRGLLSPATTLASLLLLCALLAWALAWRHRRPVFTCGLLLFFTGHFITSNVIALELVFEHRNHFPMIGVLLALMDLFMAAQQRWKVSSGWATAVAASAIAGVAFAGAARAHAWGEPLRFARYSVDIAPDSPRAWLKLGGTYFDLAGRKNRKDSPYLGMAIDTVERAAKRTGSPSAYLNIVVYKTIQGSIAPADWNALVHSLEQAPMLVQTKNVLWIIQHNVQSGIGLDKQQSMRVIETIARRASLSGEEWLRIGVFIYRDMPQREAALPYFLHAARSLPAGDGYIRQLETALIQQGHGDWSRAIQRANKAMKPGEG